MEDTRKYIVRNAVVTMVEDDYKEGEIGEMLEYAVNVNVTGCTVSETIEKAASEIGYGVKAEDMWMSGDGYLSFGVLTYADGNELDDRETELWKKGQIKGYSLEASFKVEMLTEVSSDEIIGAGVKKG